MKKVLAFGIRTQGMKSIAVDTNLKNRKESKEVSNIGTVKIVTIGKYTSVISI